MPHQLRICPALGHVQSQEQQTRGRRVGAEPLIPANPGSEPGAAVPLHPCSPACQGLLRAFHLAFSTCQSRLLPSQRSQMWSDCFRQNFPNTKFQPKADAAHRKLSPRANCEVISK